MARRGALGALTIAIATTNYLQTPALLLVALLALPLHRKLPLLRAPVQT